MIKHIVKRSGAIEPYIPHKAHQWIQWAGEEFRGREDWSAVALESVAGLPETVGSQEYQKNLINTLIYRKNWPAQRMAGRLYATQLKKQLYGRQYPKVRDLFSTMQEVGLMVPFSYSDDEWAQIETFIQHDRDLSYTHFQIEQIYHKYGVQNREKKIKYETPQFTYMRMALALCDDEPLDTRMALVKDFYDYFSLNIINAPTPNYVNLGTPMRGYASCCLYLTDDNADSIDVGNLIASKMTRIGAGMGGMIQVRSPGDPVRRGAITHNGKLRYLKTQAETVKQSVKAGRDGASTQYFSIYDPEAIAMGCAQNPKAPEDRRIGNTHFCFIYNEFLLDAVDEDIELFEFNIFTAPQLYAAMFDPDVEVFKKEYALLLADDSFKKTFFNARDRVITLLEQEVEVSTLYDFNATEVNRHTAFLERIKTSNLCNEVTQVTFPYYSEMDLYSSEDHGRGEISVCSLAARNVAVDLTDEQMARAYYLMLKMIDKCIHLSEYPFPHLTFTARQRLNAGVGITGMATYLAKRGLKYSSMEGLRAAEELHEDHMFFLIQASLQLGKELGNAPWIHKTKWPEGWMPIDTCNRNFNKLLPLQPRRDWEGLRAQVIANGGIRNSTLAAHMPCESSSKASGAPNGLYPVRRTSIIKSDETNSMYWVAQDSDILDYELAFDVDYRWMAMHYAAGARYSDQSISADGYIDRSESLDLKHSELLDRFMFRARIGQKTQYYTNNQSRVGESSGKKEACVSGACDV